MSSSSQEIISAIQSITNQRNEDKPDLIIAEINSVNLEERIANVTTISGKAANTFDVNLQAVPSDGLLVSPSIGSTVYILMSTYTTPFIVQYSDIDNVFYSLSGSINTGKANLNGHEYGGMIIIQKLVDKINILESKLNEIQLWGSAVTPPFPDPQTIEFTKVTDIENNTVTHGQQQ